MTDPAPLAPPKPWLTVVGMGDDGPDGLSPARQALIANAAILAGNARLMALVEKMPGRNEIQKKIVYETLEGFLDDIGAHRDAPGGVVVLATGDPMSHGVGVTLSRRFSFAEMLVLPHPGAFSEAAARLGWALQDVECVSIHNRPPETLLRHVGHGVRLLVLCRDGKTPSVVAHMLARKGFADSVMTVFEHLGGVRETRREAIIYEWTNEPCADLCLIALDCVLDAGLSVPGALPGLEDDLFDHDGMMTKREVRTVTLSSLAPTPGALLWDVGAGCGSVAIEWMRVQSRTKAVAFESDRARIAKLARNAVLLGVPELDVVFGRAPAILAERPDDEIPDAVFIGGGLGEDGVLEACWERLRVGGTLVANAVTIEAELRLMAWHQDHGGDLSRISVSRLEPISDRFNAWKAAAPVTHYRVIKQ